MGEHLRRAYEADKFPGSTDITPLRLLRHPKAAVVSRPSGWHTVYGWSAEVVLSDGRTIPARLFVGRYRWLWLAQWARRRWLRRHGGQVTSTSEES